jgi:hypothetical protein
MMSPCLRAKSWRAALGWVLAALLCIAPAAKAACDIEALSGPGHGEERVVASTAAAHAGLAGGDWCCADVPGSVTEHTRPMAGDGGLVPLSPAPALAPAASWYLVISAVRADEAPLRTSLPPVERVFRRVPKLLI